MNRRQKPGILAQAPQYRKHRINFGPRTVRMIGNRLHRHLPSRPTRRRILRITKRRLQAYRERPPLTIQAACFLTGAVRRRSGAPDGISRIFQLVVARACDDRARRGIEAASRRPELGIIEGSGRRDPHEPIGRAPADERPSERRTLPPPTIATVDFDNRHSRRSGAFSRDRRASFERWPSPRSEQRRLLCT